MSWSFNPFTGNLDLVGAGALVFEGEVETFDDLPATVGDPAVGASYLVRTSTGVWLVNRRQAGIWIRRNNTGVRDTDWEYGGDYPVNSVNGQTGNVSLTASDVGALAESGIALSAKALADEYTGNPALIYTSEGGMGWYTLAEPENFRAALGLGPAATGDFAAPPAIGSTTRNTGAFTTLSATPAAGSTALTLTGGTVTASVPVMSVTQTWNNAAGSFTTAEMRTSVTAGNGYLFRIFAGSTGTTERFRVAADGEVNAGITLTVAGAGGGFSSPNFSIGNQNHWRSGSNGALVWTETANNAFAGAQDLFIRRDAAGTLAQYNGSNPQAYRIYNTFTDASNYERGFMRWSSNVLQIGTENAGTGSARGMEITTPANLAFRATTVSGNIEFYTGGTILRWRIAGGSGFLQSESGIGVRFGGSSTSFPRLVNVGAALRCDVADGSGAYAAFECGALTLNGNLTASTRNIVTDTTTGTRIGTATTQLLGFWNAAPSAQPAAVADATDAASTQARLNDLLARLRTIGIIAT